MQLFLRHRSPHPPFGRLVHLKESLDFYTRYEDAATEWFTYPLKTENSVLEQRIEGPNMDSENVGTLLTGEEYLVAYGWLGWRDGIGDSKGRHLTLLPKEKLSSCP